MNKRLLAVFLVAFVEGGRAAMLSVGETNEAGEYRPDLSQDGDLKVDADGYFTLKNAKWVVYDEDLDVLNARMDVNRFVIDSTATLVFDNTTKGTTKDNIFHNSSGTFVKRGPSTMVVTGGNNWRVGSKIYVNEGVWEQAAAYTIAASRNGGSNYVYVASGAAIRLVHASTLSGAVLHVSGSGVDGGGALVIDDFSSAAITRLILEGDTLITVNKDGRFLGGYTQTSGAAGKINPAELTLNGHRLTVGGTANRLSLYNVLTFGEQGGDIVFRPRQGGLNVELYNGLDDEFENYDFTCVDAITLPDGAVLKLGGGFEVFTPNLVCAGDVTLTSYGDRSGADLRNLTGWISVAEGKTLNVRPCSDTGSRDAWTFNLRGSITGGGSIAFGSSESPANGTVYLWNTNTYAGTTTVNGQAQFKLYSCTGESIPSLETLTVNGGTVLPTLTRDSDAGTPLWDGERLLAIHRRLGADAVAPCVGCISDASSVTVTPVQAVAAYPDGVAWMAVGSGAGGYSLVGPYTAEMPLNIAWSNGTLRLTGPDAITLGSAQVAPGGQPIDEPSTLLLDGATVVFGEDGLNVGSRRQDATRDPGYARLVVMNSILSCSVDEISSDVFNGTLFVGRNACGTLEVEDGAVVSNRLVVGGGGGSSSATSKGAGYGMVLQRGGMVVARGSEDSGSLPYTSNVGGAGEGYYELSGGELKTVGYFGVGNYSHGTFLQLGGKATYGGAFQLGYANGGNGHYTLLGGTTICKGAVNLSGGTSGESFLTVSGSGAHFDCENASYSRLSLIGRAAPLRATICVNDGGMLTTTGFLVSRVSTLDCPVILNFDGGVLRHCASNESVFGYSTSSAGRPKVVVYEKGVVFDSNGTDITTVDGTITAEKTGGIQAIDLAAPVEGCFIPPEVSIKGDGFGASATALVDARTHTLTNILVTSHGWGYTPANTAVTLLLARTAINTDREPEYAVTFTVGENEVGGLTKCGEGTMTVMNANEWEKWTKVLGGTLKVGAANAVPDGTVLTLSNGATFDFGNFPEPVFTGLGGTGGTAVNGVIRMTGPLSVSAKAFVDQTPCAITGTVDFSNVTSLTLTDVEELTEDRKSLKAVSLISATAFVLPEGGLTVRGVPEGWYVTVHNNRIRLGPDRGMLLIVR